MNFDDRVLTANDIMAFLAKNNAEFLMPHMAPWPCTIVPRDQAASVKYLSVFKDGTEFVARTVCDRQSGVDFYTENSQIFSCVVCGKSFAPLTMCMSSATFSSKTTPLS